MDQVHFFNCGRHNKSWSGATDAITYEWLRKQVKRNADVLSNDIEFYGGYIYSGAHFIGRYEVEQGNKVE